MTTAPTSAAEFAARIRDDDAHSHAVTEAKKFARDIRDESALRGSGIALMEAITGRGKRRSDLIDAQQFARSIRDTTDGTSAPTFRLTRPKVVVPDYVEPLLEAARRQAESLCPVVESAPTPAPRRPKPAPKPASKPKLDAPGL